MNLPSKALSVFVAAVFSLVLFASGCGGGSKTQIRFANMSPDESQLSLLVDGNNLSTVNFESNSGYLSVSSGSRHVQVEAPGSSSAVIDQTLNLNSGSDTTIFALNYSSSITPLVLTDDNSAPSSGDIKIRVVNGAPGLGPADIYVVAPGTDITTVSPNAGNVPFGAASGYFSLPAGSYDVIFTATGQKFSSIDSGTLNLTSGQIRTIVGLSTFSGFTTAELSDLN